VAKLVAADTQRRMSEIAPCDLEADATTVLRDPVLVFGSTTTARWHAQRRVLS
jgi:hypothetical protein